MTMPLSEATSIAKKARETFKAFEKLEEVCEAAKAAENQARAAESKLAVLDKQIFEKQAELVKANSDFNERKAKIAEEIKARLSAKTEDLNAFVKETTEKKSQLTQELKDAEAKLSAFQEASKLRMDELANRESAAKRATEGAERSLAILKKTVAELA